MFTLNFFEFLQYSLNSYTMFLKTNIHQIDPKCSSHVYDQTTQERTIVVMLHSITTGSDFSHISKTNVDGVDLQFCRNIHNHTALEWLIFHPTVLDSWGPSQ